MTATAGIPSFYGRSRAAARRRVPPGEEEDAEALVRVAPDMERRPRGGGEAEDLLDETATTRSAKALGTSMPTTPTLPGRPWCLLLT